MPIYKECLNAVLKHLEIKCNYMCDIMKKMKFIVKNLLNAKLDTVLKFGERYTF